MTSANRLGRPFWLLLGSSAGANFADGAMLVAMPLLATTLTRDPVAISALASLQFLPWLLFAVLSGALVDRYPRRLAMGWANIFRVAVMIGVCALIITNQMTLLLIYISVFLIGMSETIFDSAGRAMLPEVVGRPNLERGNAWLTATDTTGQTFIAPPLGSFLFAAATVSPFIFGTVGWAVSAALVFCLPKARKAAAGRPRARVMVDVKAGLGWLWRHDFLRRYTILCGFDSGIHAMSSGVLVLYGLQTLRLSQAQFGLWILSAGVGGLIGAVAAPLASRRIGRTRSQSAALFVGAVAIIPMWLTTSPWLAGVAFGITAGAVSIWNINSMSVRQAIIPTELFGRVQGAYRTLVWGLIPVGSLVGGVIAKWTSIPVVFLVTGALALVTATLIGRLLSEYKNDIATAYVGVGES